MTTKRLLCTFFIAAMAVCLCVWGATCLPSYQDCKAYGSHYNAKSDQQNSSKLASKAVVQNNTFFDCEGFAANANGDAITAIATVVMAIFTIALASIGWRAGEHFGVTERAYVRMSHVTPDNAPALTFDDSSVALLRVQIKNWGRTPARILALHVETNVLPRDQKLPLVPQYRTNPVPLEVFLVPSASFYTPGNFTHPIDIDAVRSGTLILRIIGYVDYVDGFGQRHRSTYGREFVPAPKSSHNNLSFIVEGGYNDDVPSPSSRRSRLTHRPETK